MRCPQKLNWYLIVDNKIKDGLKSLFTIAKNIADGIDQYVSEDIKNERLSLCNACPKLTATRQCSECLCFIDFKTTLKQEKCPLDKWTEIAPTEI